MCRTLVAAVVSLLLAGCTLNEVAPSKSVTVLPQLSPAEVAAIPEGARVEVDRRLTDADTLATTYGVVLKSSPEGLALANCTVVGTTMRGVPIANKVPYVSRLYKNTGTATESVPVLWLPLEQISSVHVVEPPPADYSAPSVEIETVEVQTAGIDFDFQSTDTAVSRVDSADID